MKTTKILFYLSVVTAMVLAAMVSVAVANNFTPMAGVVTFIALFGGAVVHAHAYRGQAGMLNAGCSLITTGFVAGCSTTPVAGLEVDLYVANRSEIDLTASTFGTDGELTAIVMQTGKKFYKFTGKGTSNSLQIDMVEGKFSNDQWSHLLKNIVFDNTALTKKNIIKKFPSSDLVVVVNNKWKGTGGNMAFEALGWTVGLTGKAIQRKSDNAETAGAWEVTLASPKDQYEDNPGINVFITDYATTLAMMEALIV